MSAVERAIDPRKVELLVVGPADRRAQLQQAMQELAPLLHGVDRLEQARARIVADTSAIVLLDVGEHGFVEDVTALRTALGDRRLPIVVVAEKGRASSQVREAYAAGATAVLEWPTEVLLVPELLRELLELPGEALPNAAADVSLTEAVAARLRLDEVLAHRASCRVVGTAAVVRGELASPWERDRLVRLVAAVPGVTHVVDHGVVVRPATVPDRELDEKIADIVRSTGNVEGRELEVSVHAGVVTLAGHAARETATRVRNAVRSIPGVQRVNDVTTSER